MEKEIITRKDGITYERKKRTLNQTFGMTLRVQKELVDKLKVIAESQGKKYQPLAKEILCKYIEENYDECQRNI